MKTTASKTSGKPLHKDESAMLDRIRREGRFVTTINSVAVRLLMMHIKARGLVVSTFEKAGTAEARTVWTLAK